MLSCRPDPNHIGLNFHSNQLQKSHRLNFSYKELGKNLSYYCLYCLTRNFRLNTSGLKNIAEPSFPGFRTNRNNKHYCPSIVENNMACSYCYYWCWCLPIHCFPSRNHKGNLVERAFVWQRNLWQDKFHTLSETALPLVRYLYHRR